MLILLYGNLLICVRPPFSRIFSKWFDCMILIYFILEINLLVKALNPLASIVLRFRFQRGEILKCNESCIALFFSLIMIDWSWNFYKAVFLSQGLQWEVISDFYLVLQRASFALKSCAVVNFLIQLGHMPVSSFLWLTLVFVFVLAQNFLHCFIFDPSW